MSDLISRAKKVQAPVLGHYTEIEAARGEGCWLYDKNGTAYLDFACGIAVTNLGHCPPSVVKAAETQLHKFIHNCAGVTYAPAVIAFCEDLVSVTPGLQHVFLCQSGSEAIEAGLKFAKYVTKRPGLVAFKGGFHGRTLGATSVTSSKDKYYKPYEPLLPLVQICDRTLAAVNALDLSQVGGMITELVTGEGGYVVQDKAFIQGLRKICDEKGIVLIFDEVQTGFGRTGKMFAYEQYGVVPDAIALAKGIASGFPLAALVMKEELSKKWSTSAHGGTYTGNPVACAAGSATIQELKKLLPSLPEKAVVLEEGLRSLQDAFPQHIKELRGMGLMWAVDLKDTEKAKQARLKALEKKLLLITCGPNDDALRIIPPLIATTKEFDIFFSVLREVFSELA